MLGHPVPARHLEGCLVLWSSIPRACLGMGNTPHTHPRGLNITRHPLSTPGDTQKQVTAPILHTGSTSQTTRHTSTQHATQAMAHPDSTTEEARTSLDLHSRRVWGHECGHGAMTHTEPTAIYLLCPLAMFSQERAL